MLFDQLIKTVSDWFKTDEEKVEISRDSLLMRSMGETIPLSIGTAMIIEAPTAQIKKWEKVVLINIRTLLRNIYQAVPSEMRETLQPQALYETLIEEMRVLKQVIPENKPGTIVDFYMPDYNTIYRSFKQARPREFKTKLQQQEVGLFYHVEELIKKHKEDKDHPFPYTYRESDWQLSRDNQPTTLLTSFPTDLLSQYCFPRCNLLESHTGRVKGRSEWYTKLNKVNQEDLSMLPFNKFTISVFGENYFFLVSHRRIKALVLNMAKRDKWSYTTTDSKIKSSIGRLVHQMDKEILLKFF